MTTYAAWHPALTKLYPYSERWYKWALYDRDPLEKWSVGRATLLGDSAHAMLPYLGTGAGMALEDACVLAAEIGRGAGGDRREIHAGLTQPAHDPKKGLNGPPILTRP
jgi:salicylate hydroxylase